MSTKKHALLDNSGKELLYKEEVAVLLGINIRTFQKIESALVASGRIKPILMGKRAKYRRGAIIDQLIHCEKTGEPFYEDTQGHMVGNFGAAVHPVHREEH